MKQEKAIEIELLVGARQSGETDNAMLACNDWLRLGSGRSMPKLLDSYRQKSEFVRGFAPPTTSYKSLGTWSSRFDWPSRASAYDVEWEQRKNAEREASLNYGLALDYERVNKLKTLAAFLEAQIYEQSTPDPATGIQVFHNIWVPDVKSVGGGDNAERVDIERFNTGLIVQYREVLSDLAKEVGGRIQKTDVTSDGKPLPIVVLKMDINEL